jgi:hypothetical protein
VKTWELVVSDGGSTDGTGELVERYRGPCVGMTTEKAHGELTVVRRGASVMRASLPMPGEDYCWTYAARIRHEDNCDHSRAAPAA